MGSLEHSKPWEFGSDLKRLENEVFCLLNALQGLEESREQSITDAGTEKIIFRIRRIGDLGLFYRFARCKPGVA